jgi:purine catabolism regulator
VDRYVLDLLQPLIAYDNHHNKNLLPTLVCYFETNRSIKDTAQILYTHYNTIVYRMERIKQLLAVDFENPDIQLQLQLAIKIYLIYKQKYNSHQDNTESR